MLQHDRKAYIQNDKNTKMYFTMLVFYTKYNVLQSNNNWTSIVRFFSGVEMSTYQGFQIWKLQFAYFHSWLSIQTGTVHYCFRKDILISNKDTTATTRCLSSDCPAPMLFLSHCQTASAWPKINWQAQQWPPQSLCMPFPVT